MWVKECYVGVLTKGVIHVMPHWRSRWDEISKHLDKGLDKFPVDFEPPFADLLPPEPVKKRATKKTSTNRS